MAPRKHNATTKQIESSKSRNARGATMSKEVTKAIANGQKFGLQWDDQGESIGPNSAKLKSFIDTTVKRLVRVTFSDWRCVPDTLKDMVWKEVLTGFILPKEKKDWVVKIANVLWRRFKSDLTTIYMFDKDGEILSSPPEQYAPYITQEQWTEFVAVCQSPPFKESNEAHRQLAQKNLYPYRGSCQGYPGIGQEMKLELGSSVVPPCQDIWKRARKHKDGHFSPDVQEVVDKMDQLSEQEKEGEIAFSGRGDLLSMTLDKREHPGCVRGLSQNLTITDYFGHASRGKSLRGSGVTEEDVAVAAQEIKKMEEKLRQMQEHHTQSQAQSQVQINEMQ